MRRTPTRKSIVKDDTRDLDTVTVALSKGKRKAVYDESFSAIKSATKKSNNDVKTTKQGGGKKDGASKSMLATSYKG